MISKTQYINNLYNNSQQLLSAIDHKHKDFNGAIETKAITEYKTFLKERHKNPTMTAIIMNETLNQNPIKNNDAIMNLIRLKKDPEVDMLEKQNEHLYLSYKKSGKIRGLTLDNGRIKIKIQMQVII